MLSVLLQIGRETTSPLQEVRHATPLPPDRHVLSSFTAFPKGIHQFRFLPGLRPSIVVRPGGTANVSESGGRHTQTNGLHLGEHPTEELIACFGSN